MSIRQIPKEISLSEKEEAPCPLITLPSRLLSLFLPALAHGVPDSTCRCEVWVPLTSRTGEKEETSRDLAELTSRKCCSASGAWSTWPQCHVTQLGMCGPATEASPLDLIRAQVHNGRMLTWVYTDADYPVAADAFWDHSSPTRAHTSVQRRGFFTY